MVHLQHSCHLNCKTEQHVCNYIEVIGKTSIYQSFLIMSDIPIVDVIYFWSFIFINKLGISSICLVHFSLMLPVSSLTINMSVAFILTSLM